MKLSTPLSISDWFYMGIDTKAKDRMDELLGLSIGRFYMGLYGTDPNQSNHLDRITIGFLNKRGTFS